MLADLGRALNSAIAGLNGNSAIDEAVSNDPFPFFASLTQYCPQALDLSLRSIAAALLSSDVNVLLVKKLRESVKGKVLPQLVEIAKKSGDNTAGQKGKAIIQKVSSLVRRIPSSPVGRICNDELTTLRRLYSMSWSISWIREKARPRRSKCVFFSIPP